MSRLFVVRHGQARFLTDDYDRLSDLGKQQSEALGQAWLTASIRPMRAYAGTLERQRDTAAGVAAVFGGADIAFPETEVVAGLDEYPADELIAELVPRLRRDDPAVDRAASEFESATDDAARYRPVHRLLEAVMRAWVAGDYSLDSVSLPTWTDFSGGVRQALRSIMSEAPRSADVAVFTSGGPIGITVQTVLEAPEIKAAELNWRVHNASVTALTFSGSGARISLDSFNDVAHLGPEMRTFR
ncbi:MAG: histidine phosphatase family protein [Pseudomonadota bacterium]